MKTILSDRSYETTKLLQRSKGVFSKTRRTLTSPPQFRIGLISGQEELITTANDEKCFCNYNSDHKLQGTVTPTHNCKNCNSDSGYTLARDWKPFPFLYKGNAPCKHNSAKKQFLTDSEISCPGIQYISDHRPRGLSLQQLDSAKCFFETIGRITLTPLLNSETMGMNVLFENMLEFYKVTLEC